MTYASKYALGLALGVAAEEDDDASGTSAPVGARDKASQSQMKLLHALAKQKGVTHEQMRDWAGRHLGIESLTELSKPGAKEMMESLKALPDVEEGSTDETGYGA
jgi:RecB family exonuclease